MTKLEFFKYSINKRYHLKLNWYYYILGILNPNTMEDNIFLTHNDTHFQVKLDSEVVDLIDFPINGNKPMFYVSDTIKANSGICPNIGDKEIDTTIGRVLANLILLVHPFGVKLPYINGEVSVKGLESIIGPMMRENKILVDEYLKFTTSCTFITNLSKLVSVSATRKNTIAPPGIKEYKKKIQEEMDKEYGPGWRESTTLITVYKNKLQEYDKEWLKDDPTLGKLLDKKITDNSRTKVYLTVGNEQGFDKANNEAVFIDNSLEDGLPKDPKQLATMYNAIRSGSFDRGHETQKGGAAAKEILRSSATIVIHPGDCRSNKGYTIKVSKNNSKYLVGRYLLQGVKRIDDGTPYIGNDVVIRSPMYCRYTDGKICATCAGDVASANPNGISMGLLEISGILLKISLKSMHDSQGKNLNYSLIENIK